MAAKHLQATQVELLVFPLGLLEQAQDQQLEFEEAEEEVDLVRLDSKTLLTKHCGAVEQ